MNGPPVMSPDHDAESFSPAVEDRETDWQTLVDFADPRQLDEIEVYTMSNGRRFTEVDPYEA